MSSGDDNGDKQRPKKAERVRSGGFIDNRTRALRNLVRPASDSKARKKSISHVLSTIAGAFQLIFTGSAKHYDAEMPEYDIREVEKMWGINDDNRSTVIKGHYIEGILFMLLGLFGLFQIYSGLFLTTGSLFVASKIFGGILLCVVAFMRITVLMWRVDVLKGRQWVSYPQWLRGK